MRQLVLVSGAALLLAGCNGGSAINANPHQGRYQGIGVFDAGPGWKAMTDNASPDAKRTSFRRDDHVIVVVDSISGEVRQCGDYSGHCIAMNPWNKALPPGQQLPVELNPIAEGAAGNTAAE